MRGVDAVVENITEANERIGKLLAAGRIEPDSTLAELRRLLVRAEVLASEVRARELIVKEVISVGNRSD